MNWPPESGDYIVGDESAPVAVVTLTSEYTKWNLKNYAICGRCYSENFGIEKILVNVLSNPNITCVVVCGLDSAHLAGQSLVALYENGVSTLGGFIRINGSRAALPYLNEMPIKAISRFRSEVRLVNLIGTTDPRVVQDAIDSCSGKPRDEVLTISMPEVDEDSWRKYEKMVTKGVKAHLKKL